MWLILERRSFFINPNGPIAKFIPLADDKVLNTLLEVPIGHHYLILYQELETMRKVYSNYVKGQIEAQPESVTILLLYYDTTEKAREILESKSIPVRELERQGSIVLVDIMKVIRNQSFDVPPIETLRALTKKLEEQYPDKTIFTIADMSVFHHLKNSTELLDYEKTLHQDLKIEKWKELCFYNERDFNLMFTEEQAIELLTYHKDRVMRV